MLISCLALACSKDHSSNNEGVYINTTAYISLKDTLGRDLFDPGNPNFYNYSDIAVFYLINGKTQEIYDPNQTAPRNFLMESTKGADSLYTMHLFLNDKEKSAYTTTYLQLSQTDTDTIVAHVVRKGNTYISVDSAWYNGIPGIEGRAGFEIVKTNR